MLTLTLVRTVCLSLIFTFLKEFGFIFVASIGLISIIPIVLRYRALGQPALLGAFIGMFGPCLVVYDFNFYFLVNGIINSIGYMIGMIILTVLVGYDQAHNGSYGPYNNFSYPKAFDTSGNQSSNYTLSGLFERHPFFKLISHIIVGLNTVSLPCRNGECPGE